MRLILILALLLAACGRPLAPPERAFLANLEGATLDTAKVRIHPGLITLTRTGPVPPRDTCQSRLYPPLKRKTYTGAAPATTLWNHIFVRNDWYARDMTGGVPQVLDLPQAMVLAHEVLHTWQWQHRATTGYTPWKAFAEHFGNPDPYLFDPDTKADFNSFGFEQQGAIIEEYLCCRVLAPDAQRTRRLQEMLEKVLPISPLSVPLARNVGLPWRGVQIDGICG